MHETKMLTDDAAGVESFIRAYRVAELAFWFGPACSQTVTLYDADVRPFGRICKRSFKHS